LRGLLADDAIKSIVSNIDSLPSLPSLYTEIVEELQSPSTSIAKLGQIISRDMGMTAKVLQLVNSAFFGLQQHVSNTTQAVTLLGVDTIRALVLLVHIFSQYESTSPLSLEELTRHSFLTGILAKTLAREENQRQIVIDDSFMAGLLHDVGKPILSINFPDQYGKAWGMVQEKKIFPWEAEKEVFGVTHSEVGAYLTGLWGLPDSIVEGLAFHHNPNQCQAGGFSPLVAVHVASALEKEGDQSDIREPRQQINREYLAKLDMLPRLPMWEETCRKVIAGGQGND
jgi:putative nucleotidyltransferase with HDIG domain